MLVLARIVAELEVRRVICEAMNVRIVRRCRNRILVGVGIHSLELRWEYMISLFTKPCFEEYEQAACDGGVGNRWSGGLQLGTRGSRSELRQTNVEIVSGISSIGTRQESSSGWLIVLSLSQEVSQEVSQKVPSSSEWSHSGTKEALMESGLKTLTRVRPLGILPSGPIPVTLNMTVLGSETYAKPLVPVHSGTKKKGSNGDTRKVSDTRKRWDIRKVLDTRKRFDTRETFARPRCLKYHCHSLSRRVNREQSSVC